MPENQSEYLNSISEFKSSEMNSASLKIDGDRSAVNDDGPCIMQACYVMDIIK